MRSLVKNKCNVERISLLSKVLMYIFMYIGFVAITFCCCHSVLEIRMTGNYHMLIPVALLCGSYIFINHIFVIKYIRKGHILIFETMLLLMCVSIPLGWLYINENNRIGDIFMNLFKCLWY